VAMRELNPEHPDLPRLTAQPSNQKTRCHVGSSKVIAVVDRVTEGEKPSWRFGLGAQDAAEFAERYGNSLGFCFNGSAQEFVETQ